MLFMNMILMVQLIVATNMATDRTVPDETEFEYLSDNPSIAKAGTGLKFYLPSESDHQQTITKKRE